MKMRTNLYQHCLEISHACSLPQLDPAEFVKIIEVVEAAEDPATAAKDVCKLVGVMPTPLRMEHVTLAVSGQWQIK